MQVIHSPTTNSRTELRHQKISNDDVARSVVFHVGVGLLPTSHFEALNGIDDAADDPNKIFILRVKTLWSYLN